MHRYLTIERQGYTLPTTPPDCRLPHPSEVANNRTSKPSAPSTTFSHAAASSKGGSIAGSDCSTSLDGAPFAAGTTGGVQPVYSGSKLLQFVPEQQFSILHRSEQLVGLQQYLGHGYGVSIATLEAATAEGKAVLIVAPLAVAGALRQDLLDTQVRARDCCMCWRLSLRFSADRRQ